MIQLQDLKDFNEEDTVNLLLDQSKQPFEIFVPKSTQLFFSEPFCVADEYKYLAYAGHMIKEASDTFQYEKVPPEEHESVLFTVTAKDLNKLAANLLMLTYYDINDHEDEEFIFLEEVEQYFDDLENGRVEAACPYYIEVYEQLLSELEKEDDS